MAKQLIIDVKQTSLPPMKLNEWAIFDNFPAFIRDIETQTLSKGINAGALVSGIPTAFARVDLFKAALDQTGIPATSKNEGELMKYYQEIRNEWRGLIACIALDYPKISVKRINLEYSDHKPVEETANIYEPAGAFGNMLLERRELWCDQGASANERKTPFIDVIKYEGKVVGGTSPLTLLFTSTGYACRIDSERPYVNSVTGKFTDPLYSHMDQNQVVTLHAYVDHILKNLPRIGEYYSKLPNDLQPNYASLQQNLTDWKKEIEIYVDSKSFNLSYASTPPVDVLFAEPFSSVFKYEDKLYGLEGTIYEDGVQPGVIEFDPKKLLLPKNSQIARLHLGAELTSNPGKLRDLPIYVLKAIKKGSRDEYAYFALPLSAMGLNVFGKNIGALVGIVPDGVAIRSTLSAVFDSDAATENLEVTLKLVTNSGPRREFKEVYTVNPVGIKNKDIILWPNFISKQWNRYYLYSEMPHNISSVTYSASPFVGDIEDVFFRILQDKVGKPMSLARNGEIVADRSRVKVNLLVEADNRVADNSYKYEIYESDRPFKGVRLTSSTGREGGYLIINYSTDSSSNLPANRLNSDQNLKEVCLGVDFGSTNTSVAYFDETQTEAKGFRFKNQRVALLGNDDHNKGARESQIFFFQGREIESNAIKSILTLHDPRRLREEADEQSPESRFEKEVKGGFPCFMDNLPVSEVSSEIITLKFNKIGIVKQIHNMKWSDRRIDKAHREAFLRTLMLHVYAYLFNEGYVPTVLKWSYPSSMSDILLNQYQLIWDSLENVRPVLDWNSTPYALAISRYKSNFQIPQDDDSWGDDSGWGASDGDSFSEPFGNFSMGNNFGGNDVGIGGDSLETGADSWGSDSQSSGWDDATAGSNDGFSAASDSDTKADGWGDNKPKTVDRPDLKPDDPNRQIMFNPERLNQPGVNESMTEAVAVANYLQTNKNIVVNQNGILTLCFDIGGSTTDISALFMLKQGVTLIKQNSLRFAAQRVSSATMHIPEVKDLLTRICAQFGMRILGLNEGPDRFSSDTAPYYFEQVVDRLQPDQLVRFYRLLIAEYPKLLCVNLYVTGLLMYYAGQLTVKLIDELRHTDHSELSPMNHKPKVNIVFAGKGSRLLEWFSTTDIMFARKYYEQAYYLGMGGIEIAKRLLFTAPEIKLHKGCSPDVKYEVSKGLANSKSDLFRPADGGAKEIIGESNFTIIDASDREQKVESTNSITPEMIEYIGKYFNPGIQNPCANFSRFSKLFYNAITGKFGIRIPQNVFVDGFRNLNITQFVKNQPEFTAALKAKRNKQGSFDFVAPIIILEGMKFYDDFLIPAIARY